MAIAMSVERSEVEMIRIKCMLSQMYLRSHPVSMTSEMFTANTLVGHFSFTLDGESGSLELNTRHNVPETSELPLAMSLFLESVAKHHPFALADPDVVNSVRDLYLTVGLNTDSILEDIRNALSVKYQCCFFGNCHKEIVSRDGKVHMCCSAAHAQCMNERTKKEMCLVCGVPLRALFCMGPSFRSIYIHDSYKVYVCRDCEHRFEKKVNGSGVYWKKSL